MPTIRAVDINLIELKFDKPVGGSGVSGVDIIVARHRRQRRSIRDLASAMSSAVAPVARSPVCAARSPRNSWSDKPCQHPAAHWAAIKKSFNRTGDGPNMLALAALDVANWDLKAHQDQTPLCVALGGRSGAVPVYASGGFGPNAAPEAVGGTGGWLYRARLLRRQTARQRQARR